MVALTLTAEEMQLYEHIVELEKAGGSRAFLDAIESARILRYIATDNGLPIGFPRSAPLTGLGVESRRGVLKGEGMTRAGYGFSGRGAGFISTDVSIHDDVTLHYFDWTLMLHADSFVVAGSAGYLFIYFTMKHPPPGIPRMPGIPLPGLPHSPSIPRIDLNYPVGVIKAKARFGAVGGKGTCKWKHWLDGVAMSAQ